MTELEIQLLTLLDKIEVDDRAEDWLVELTRQRLDIAKACGYELIFSQNQTSSREQ